MFYFVLILFSGVFVCYSVYEYNRWGFTEKQCKRKEETNRNLKESGNCLNPHLYNEEMQRLCQKAKIEHEDVDLFACTIRDFWQESWIYQLGQLFHQNHWLLFGTLVVPVCALIYFSFDSCRQLREEERQDKMFNKLLEKVPTNLSLPPASVVQQPQPVAITGDYPHDYTQKKRKLYIRSVK